MVLALNRSLRLVCVCTLLIAVISCNGNFGSVKTAQGGGDVTGYPALGTPASHFVLGTICNVKVPEGTPQSVVDSVFKRFKEIDDEMSANKEGTEITEANALSGKARKVLSPDLFGLLARALDFARVSGGAFDPSIGPVVKLWGIGTESPRVPAPSEIAAALKLVDYRKVELDPKDSSVYLPLTGMKLDLGGIAKGYAADEAVRILRAAGVRRAIIDLGGNIYALGRKGADAGWSVGILDPFRGKEDRGLSIGYILCEDETIVTSGVYERFFVDGATGRRYHHIMDTRTGYPIENGLVSATVVTKDSTEADALAKYVFRAGLEGGVAAGEAMGVGVILIDGEKRIYLSRDMKERFELIDESYVLVE